VTPHFTEAEVVTTLHPQLQDRPTEDEAVNAIVLAASVLEPWRLKIAVPLDVTSWYRGDRLNEHVGGVDTSLHRKAAAADVIPRGIPRMQAWTALLDMIAHGLPITEAIIYEAAPHIHVAYAWWRPLGRPDVLVKTASGRYLPWTRYGGSLKRET